MMSMSFLVQSLPLAALATICTVAILSEKFHDNLAQRVGMSLVAVGSVLQVVAEFNGSQTFGPFTTLAYGASIYALGTFKKVIQHMRSRPHDERI